MAKLTRSEFLGMAALAAIATPAKSQSTTNPRPDLAVLNAGVYTIDDTLPRAEAFAIKDGRFLAIGSTADIRNIVHPQTQIIDAAGMTVTPGFIDCHNHPSGINELYGVNTNLPTKAEIIGALRTRAAQTPPATGSPASCTTTPR